MKPKSNQKQVKISTFFKRNVDDVGTSDQSGGGKRQKQPHHQPQPRPQPQPQSQPQPHSQPQPQCPQGPQPREETTFGVHNLPYDPGKRQRITMYKANEIEEIRRESWVNGPCRPRDHKFPKVKDSNGKNRRFVKEWFDQYNWLEYSVKKNKAYGLCCYLFGDDVGKQGGRDTFVVEGFDNWGKKRALRTHVGEVNSIPNKARQKCENLVMKNASIHEAFHKRTALEESRYEARLRVSCNIARFLLKLTLPFRGHDESHASFNKGIFLELLEYTRELDEGIRNYTGEKAPHNEKLTSPKIQKEIVKCYSKEITKSIREDIGDGVFAILVDESSDVAKQEQMAMVLRYVNSEGIVKEIFFGLVHVKDTASATLKEAIDSIFAKHNLAMSQVRGQGYDGASNMRGTFNGLKALILKENEAAYYVHCFAHQLQLVVVAVAKNHDGVHNFFDFISMAVNVVGGSCKRQDKMKEQRKARVEKEIGSGELETGSGQNQEIVLARAGDTRWGSHYRTLTSLKNLFPEVIETLKYVEADGTSGSNRTQAYGIRAYFNTIDFVFYLHLMLKILGLTDTLSKLLQQKDQNILEAASLVKTTMNTLKLLRANGFSSMMEEVVSFCHKHKIPMVEMSDFYVTQRRRNSNITNHHHFEYDVFNTVMDIQNQEFANRFSEASTNLLDYMSALSPCNSFSMFDIEKLVKLSGLYKADFNDLERSYLGTQLETYYHSVIVDERFGNLKGITDLSRLMVKTGKDRTFPLVYRLLKLTLVLPVATASVERCFSAMKLLKTDFRNRIGDHFLNDALICGVEKEALVNVNIEDVMVRYRKMGKQKG